MSRRQAKGDGVGSSRAFSARALATYSGLVLCVAVAYAITSYLSLYLAIPPGYASPVWPASAVALVAVLRLGYRFLPGVFFGSLAINLVISVNNGNPLDWGLSTFIAASIALGAAFQAAISASLVRRFVSFPNSMEQAGDIAKVTWLGGPVGCLVNSLWGTFVLHATGVLSTSALSSTWFTWWIGDALGVILLGPWLLLVSSGKLTEQATRKRWVTLAHLGVFWIVVACVSLTKHAENRRSQLEFETIASDVKAQFERTLAAYAAVLQAVDALYDASPDADAQAFDAFAHRYLVEYPGIYRLSFNTLVQRQERAAFEERMREQESGFYIKDRGARTGYVVAAERDVYFPVTRLAPAARQAELGFDAYSDPHRKAAIERAWLTKRPVSTGLLSRKQVGADGGLAVFHPVFNSVGAAPDRQFIGCAVGVFIIPKLAKQTAELALSRDLYVRLSEGSEVEPQDVFDSRPQRQRDAFAKYAKHSEFQVDAFGTQWTLHVGENPAAVARNDASAIWVTLIGGCLFSGLSGAFLLTVTGRTEVVQRLVDQKTAELRAQAQRLAESNFELEYLAKQADAASLAKSQFLASMSHEIRTPLNGLMGVIHLLEGDLPSEKIHLLDTAKQSADGLLVLINDILDFSKIEAGKMQLEAAEVDPVMVVEEVVRLFGASAQQKGLEIYSYVDPVAARALLGDVHRLKQVLSNLVGNAVKFTSAGSIEVSCEYRREDGGAEFVFAVRDTGIGISSAAQVALFEAFTQADASTTRRFGGSGLGLSICRKLVELMGGALRVESQLGHGSVFIFNIPQAAKRAPLATYQSLQLMGKRVSLHGLNPVADRQLLAWLSNWGASPFELDSLTDGAVESEFAADIAFYDESVFDDAKVRPETRVFVLQRGSTSRAGVTTLQRPLSIVHLRRELLDSNRSAHVTDAPVMVSFDGLSILVVDDNHTNRMIASALLERRHKNRPDTASSGPEALRMLRDKRYDIILMDCMMPDMDGYQVTATLRQGGAGDTNRGTPVIALTANAMASDRQLCLDAGMSDYLSKPINPTLLMEVLARWVGRTHQAA